ncbi:MAG: hypothetical protein IPK27_19005 [Rhodanobacteraceae bacterium]|nr:hypothetical protein [Rhodanobacteraceae bacterium]
MVVSNAGAGNKLAGQAVSVTDTPPTGLTITAMSGAGWTCTTLPTCTRNDLLAAGASYPDLTVAVTVASNAVSPQINSIAVTTAQLESNASNNSDTDSTTIVQPDLVISKAHTGVFAQGTNGNRYVVTVANIGAGTKLAARAVSVTDTAPAGMTCNTLPTCTRSDELVAGASYPQLDVFVSIAANAGSPLTNSVAVTTAQFESNSGNNAATDPTVIERVFLRDGFE